MKDKLLLKAIAKAFEEGAIFGTEEMMKHANSDTKLDLFLVDKKMKKKLYDIYMEFRISKEYLEYLEGRKNE